MEGKAKQLKPVDPPIEMTLTMSRKEFEKVKEMSAYTTTIPSILRDEHVSQINKDNVKSYAEIMQILLCAIANIKEI